MLSPVLLMSYANSNIHVTTSKTSHSNQIKYIKNKIQCNTSGDEDECFGLNADYYVFDL